MNKSVNVLLNRKIKNIKNIKKQKSKIDLESLTIENLIRILNKHQEKSLQEIALLKQYCLSKTKIKKKFINDSLDESSYDLMLSLSLPSSSYRNIKKENNVIINIGDSADYLYIILKGKAAVYEMQKINKEMSGYEYYLLLQNYKINNEKYLFDKTIKENNLVFPIELDEANILDKIMLKIFLNKQDKRSLPNYLDLILEKVGLKYSDFKLESYIEKIERRNRSMLEGIDITKMTEEEKITEYKKIMIYNIQDALNVAFRNEKKILEELNSIDMDMIKKYSFLSKTKNEEMITFYKCVFTKTIESSDYFGDSEHRKYINKVISLSNNLELFCIKTDLYNEYVRRIKSKLLVNQINFLLDNFFFRSIYKNYFEKYYFKYFELVEYRIKQIIVKENEPIQHIYFIKSGTVKLSSNRSIIENHILIEMLKNILLKTNHYDNKAQIKNALNELYSDVKNNLEYLGNEIDNKNTVHIMTLQEKNCIGSELYYYGLNYLYTAEANSDVVEVYRITIEKLIKILKDKNHRSSYYYGKYCEQSLKILFDRILKVNNMLLYNMKKNKVRQFGNIYNFDISDLKEKVIKNEKKLNNTVDKLKYSSVFKLIDSKTFCNINSADKSSAEKDNDKNNDNNNLKNDNVSNFFLTQKTPTPIYKKLTNNVFINLRKKTEAIRNQNNEHLYNNNNNHKILQNINRNKSFNIQMNEKEQKKDLTSYIKIFDEKENLQKQESREELRAKIGLVRLARAERNQIKKLKKEYKTCQNFFKLSLGENRSFAMPLYYGGNDNNDINKKYDETTLRRNYSNNNCIIDLYQRNVFSKNKMLITSLYKNKFLDYFDKKFGPTNFNYDLRKTLLTNKKVFEYSFFDNIYNNKNKIKNKSRSMPEKKYRFTNISDFNKIKSIKNFH